MVGDTVEKRGKVAIMGYEIGGHSVYNTVGFVEEDVFDELVVLKHCGVLSDDAFQVHADCYFKLVL